MARGYFEPKDLAALTDIFGEARAEMKRRGLLSPESMDELAKLIFQLASEGTPTRLILREVMLGRGVGARHRGFPEPAGSSAARSRRSAHRGQR